MQPAQDGEREQYVAAEADIGLLADRDQARVTGHEVPETGECQVQKNLAHQPHIRTAGPPGC